MLNNLLTKEQVKDFKEYGYVVIKGFYDCSLEIEPIQYGIWKILKILFEKYHIEVEAKEFSPKTFDYGYQKLISVNRRYGGEVYDAIKQIPAFMRLISLEKNDQIFMQLRNTDTPAIAAAGYGIRIDNPHEERYRSLWHYEYRDQLRSIDGIVFWSPLVALTSGMGPVKICPRSHLGGLRRSYLKDPDNLEKTGAYAMRLENEASLIAQYGTVAPLSEPGDLVLMDFLTLHSSGVNISERSRWSMQFRYFSFEDPSGISINWTGCVANGTQLKDIHPELVID
ncbi:phytanoyl-CoA dioxygenase [Pseudanabaena sp. lw0831]|uniref:phytanoyl-CoA dioxygenase family protein n=1 Tax=Pseudanabaena sp. lw0831 TaxID=1357935 RepID=UPI001915D7BE|nr:phytanoyl-CoA dioxygenase family protein [Pseudanabaena sp. lw0831]GBO52288.1 phytanoyl-CoA dioxygenase [Pseudanabaena sp. lw0831]